MQTVFVMATRSKHSMRATFETFWMPLAEQEEVDGLGIDRTRCQARR